MKTVYVVTMWSGGRPAKKWKADAAPEVLPSGNGVTLVSMTTRLRVTVVGSISIEEYESGKEEMETGFGAGAGWEPPSNIERLY
jgi:hypothetical protein